MSRAQLTSTVEQNTGGAVAPYVAGKNAVINGGMDIWQRGTSGTYTVGPFYTADRFTFNCSATTSVTVSQITTSDTTNLPNIYNAMRVQRTAGNSSVPLVVIQSTLESKDSYRFASQNVTFSFWARKGANFSPSAFTAQLISGTGTDQNLISGFTNSNGVISQSSTLTTTWQRFSYTGTMPSSATQLGFQFFVTYAGTAGAADYFDITGIQLETGSVATPFSRAGGTISGELAACQRYFYTPLNTTTDGIGGSPFLGMGWASSTTTAYILCSFPVTMRAIPSYTYSYASSSLSITTASYGITTVTSLGADQIMQRNAILSFSASGGGLVAGNAAGVRHDGAGTYIAQFSAEL